MGDGNSSLFTLLSRAGGDLLSPVQGKRCKSSAVTSSPGAGAAQDWAAEADPLSKARRQGTVSVYFQSCLTWFVLLLRAPSLPCSRCKPGERSQCHITWNTALRLSCHSRYGWQASPLQEQWGEEQQPYLCSQCPSLAGLSEGEGNCTPPEQ